MQIFSLFVGLFHSSIISNGGWKEKNMNSFDAFVQIHKIELQVASLIYPPNVTHQNESKTNRELKNSTEKKSMTTCFVSFDEKEGQKIQHMKKVFSLKSIFVVSASPSSKGRKNPK